MQKREWHILMVMVLVLVVIWVGVGLGGAEAKKGAGVGAAKGPTAVSGAAGGLFKTEMDKVSYVIGVQMGTKMRAEGLDINVELLARGMQDALMGKKLPISGAEQQKVMMDFQRKMQAKMAERQKAEAMKKMSHEDAWKLQLKQPELMKFDSKKDYFWVLETNKGTMRIKLMPDVAPMHVTSTIFLTRKGFYDNLTFHRVIPGFMAQGGCPLGTGTGGPGYKYAGEVNPKVKHDRPYLVSMANAGPGTDGSQFFLTFKETPWLDGKHTIFGEIVEGQDVMKKLEAAGSPSGKPKEKLLITKARIEEKGK